MSISLKWVLSALYSSIEFLVWKLWSTQSVLISAGLEYFVNFCSSSYLHKSRDAPWPEQLCNVIWGDWHQPVWNVSLSSLRARTIRLCPTDHKCCIRSQRPVSSVLRAVLRKRNCFILNHGIGNSFRGKAVSTTPFVRWINDSSVF